MVSTVVESFARAKAERLDEAPPSTTPTTDQTRAILEGRASPKIMPVLRGQLESLCLGHLQRESLIN
jgi:hypothetical protein